MKIPAASKLTEQEKLEFVKGPDSTSEWVRALQVSATSRGCSLVPVTDALFRNAVRR
jgi:hypothetical protein